LNYCNEIPTDETFMPPNILTGSDNEDPLSISLGKLSQQLTELRLEEITTGAEFFWNSVYEINPPYWPHLTSLSINYNKVTPGGQWLFERDPAEPIEEYERNEFRFEDMSDDELPLPPDKHFDMFRFKPLPEPMNAIYAAAGKAALHMPALRNFWLHAEVLKSWPHWFEYEATLTNACATWGNTPEFKPDESVLDAWREVSRKNVGAILDIKYTDGFW
jgi:hypothetical protein